MRLTNFWWLLIWLFTIGLMLEFLVSKRREIVNGKTEYRWRPGAAAILVFPYIIWAGFRDTTGAYGDSLAYYSMFKRVPVEVGAFVDYLETISKDKSYTIFMFLVKRMIGDHPYVFLTIVAMVQMLLFVRVFRRYSLDFWFSFFVFVASTDYMSWMHNGTRQLLAVTIIFAGTDLWVEKKYIPLILLILLAATFHASALIMIPIIFISEGRTWSLKTIILMGVTIAAIIYINQLTDFLNDVLAETQYTNVVPDWQMMGDDGTNPIRAVVYSVPAGLSFIGLKYIRRADERIINLSVGCAVCSSLIYVLSIFTSGIFIGRLPIYMGLYASGILLPWELENVFSSNSGRIVKGMAIVFYCIFFYYQMHFAWGLL